MAAMQGADRNGETFPLVPVAPPEPADGPDVLRTPVRAGAERRARYWALACHLSPFVAWSIGVPGLLAPLLIWLLKRRELPFVDLHAREAFNFQLTLLLAELAMGLFALVTFGLGLLLVIPLAVVVAVGGVVLMVVAAVRAADGRPYRYPFTWRPL